MNRKTFWMFSNLPANKFFSPFDTHGILMEIVRDAYCKINVIL